MKVARKMSARAINWVVFGAIFVALTWVLISIQAFEWLHETTRVHEHWDLDEIIVGGLAALISGIAWQAVEAYQRGVETKVEAEALREALDALSESEERFRTLIDSSSQGILVHRNLRVLYANQRFVEMFGYDSADEILALESREVMTAPEERARLLGYHKARLRGETAPVDYEYK